MYAKLIQQFLQMVQKIKSLNPAYKQPGDGSNGVCDCIGLIIGAIRRMGLKWSGIHGSNYAARYQIVGLKKITSLSEIELGDVMLKAYEKGHSKWRLPDRYWQGHQYYTGDLKDYYHAGTITSLNPIVITHMTSPSMKTLTVRSMDILVKNNWIYHGKAKPIVQAAGGVTPTPTPTPEPVPSTGSEAVVVSPNGGAVKMRQYPSTSCATWDKLAPGTRVTIVEPGETWAKIDGGRRKGWYMKAEFLDIVGDGKGQY